MNQAFNQAEEGDGKGGRSFYTDSAVVVFITVRRERVVGRNRN